MNHLQIEGLLFWFPAFVFSTTLHEAAHAWAALRMGDPTAYLGGQVSLSPIPHIRREPIGMLVLPLVTAFANGWSIGWASAPFDAAWAVRHPRRASLMAAAGPLANLAIAAVALVLVKVGVATGVFALPPAGLHAWSGLIVPSASFDNSEWIAFGARALSVVLTLNSLLAVFNLIPLPPLDGSAVLDLFLPGPMVGFMRRLGPVGSLLGLFVAWKLFPLMADPIHAFVERLVAA